MNLETINTLRQDFPILNTQVNGKKLVYFDNAATTQKPKKMIDSITDYYLNKNSNTHSRHLLADNLTSEIAAIRLKILKFFGASPQLYSVIFTKNATEAFNLVADSCSNQFSENDRLLLTKAEHHANLLPWQKLAHKTNSKLDFINIDINGNWDLSNLKTLITPKTRLISFAWVSNVLGIVNPVSELLKISNLNNSLTLIDATQAVSHFEINLTESHPDFFIFSGHKIFGPTGIGVLIAKTELLNQMEAYQVGGEMVQNASLTESTFQSGYQKFEAGTLNFSEIVGLGASLDYLAEIRNNFDIQSYESELYVRLYNNLKSLPNINIMGDSDTKIPLITFYHNNISSLDLSVFLDQAGIATRSGQHCTEPLHKLFGVNSSLRASLAFYNTIAEIDYFSLELDRIISKLSN